MRPALIFSSLVCLSPLAWVQESSPVASTRNAVLETLGYIHPETHHERGYLGAYMAHQDGAVRVQASIPGAPAALAGLLPGDRVVNVGGHEVTTDAALTSHLEGLQQGQKIVVRVERDQTMRDEEVTLAGRDDITGDEAQLRPGALLAWESIPAPPPELVAAVDGDDLDIFTRVNVTPAVAGSDTDYFDEVTETEAKAPVEEAPPSGASNAEFLERLKAHEARISELLRAARAGEATRPILTELEAIKAELSAENE